jgi:5-methyltetrahydrofolate--homocysteine methyltransferase
MLIASGMTSAITNPMQPELVRAIMAADVLMGHDEHCAGWIARFRAAPEPGADGEVRGRREGSRRRRPAEAAGTA